ncbi:MAG: phosphatidic acid phosphatase [Marmoricola sp.]|jgi:membrane-associated phospholipid phosphatase|nr:phosphatidic acid phosphatase [Marmoricola sp.]
MSRVDAAPARAGTGRRELSSQLRLRTVLALVAGLATVSVVALADAVGEHEGLSRLDPTIAADVVRSRTATLTQLARILTLLGSEVVVGGLALVVLALLLARRDFSRAAVFAVALGGSAFLTVAVKLLVGRARPGAVDRLGAVDTTYSFPSGHTLNSAVFLTMVVWLLWPALRYAARVVMVTTAAVLAVGVAASRVYLGYHWLTDVVASGLVALAWLTILWLAHSVARPRGRATGEGVIP